MSMSESELKWTARAIMLKTVGLTAQEKKDLVFVINEDIDLTNSIIQLAKDQELVDAEYFRKVLEDKNRGKLKRSRTEYEQTGFYSVFPLGDTKFFEFSTSLNDMLGREPTDPALKIYMRAENLRIAKELDTFLTFGNLLFYLQGPPGVGKTKESLMWMLQKVATGAADGPWAWIPLPKGGSAAAGFEYTVYLLENASDGSSDAAGPSAVPYKVFYSTNLLPELRDRGVSVVVFDNCDENYRGIIHVCARQGFKTIAVSSLQMKLDHSYSRQQVCTVNGWTLDEYLEACADDAFFALVKANLQTGDFSEEELDDPTMREDVVTAKYHIAGASARWMFQFSTDELLAKTSIASIAIQLDRVSFDQIVHGFRTSATNDGNTLMSRINDDPVIVSQYVANQLAFKYGEALLHQALLLMGNNPAIDSILMEMDFMMRLGRSTSRQVPIDLVMRPGADPEPAFDSGSKKIEFCLATFAPLEFTVVEDDWFVPQIVHSGGFHCVQYSNGKLTFVQVTRSPTPSFKLKWCEKFRAALVAKFPELEISVCEVWFVVPEHLVADFQPARLIGTLTGWAVGSYKVAGLRPSQPANR